MSVLQYPFPVSMVDQCPRDRMSWNASSTSRRCPVDVNGRNTYHCVPNQQTTALIEFCFPRQIGLYESGTCVYLTNSGYLNQVRCADFTHGCPERPYFSNEIYKYQECLAIDKQNHCYEAAESCWNAKNTDVSSSIQRTSLDYIPILLGVMLPIILIVILLCALFIKFRRKRNSSMEDNMDPVQACLLQEDNPCEDFIETRAYQKARDVLIKKKYVFIKGNPGDGKTTIAKHLLKELKTSYEKREKVVTGLKELCGKHDQTKDTVFFVDNIFGEFNFRSSEIEQWETTTIFMESVLSDEIDKKGNFLIVTIRNDMYSEIRTQLQFKMEFIERALVDISDFANKLTEEEMKQIFDLYVDIPFQTNEFYSALSCAPPLGFPQYCKLFGNSKTLQSRGPNFFENPSECLSQYVENMYWKSQPQFSVLVYVLTKNGRVSMSSLRNINFDMQIKREAMNICPDDKRVPHTSSEFIKCIDGLMGSFLVAENGLCTFSHSCIQKVIQNTLIKYDVSFVIQYCHMSLLINLDVEGNEEKKANLQIIDESFFEEVYKKILENLRGGRNSEIFKIISCLHFWKSKAFCSGFKKFAQQEQNVLSKFDESGASLLIYFAEAGQIEMFKILLKVITNNKQRYDALNQATLMNHINVVQILLDEGITPDAKTCFCAIQTGNKNLVVNLINSGLDLLEIFESRHPIYNNHPVSILAESCLWERLELISFILEKCPALSKMKNKRGHSTIHFVAFAGATDALKALITDHKCDPYLKSDKGDSILHCACENGKLETAKYIISKYPDLLNEEHNLFSTGSILHMVAFGGNVKLFQILKNQRLTILPQTGETVLHSACLHGRFEMSKILIERFPYLLTLKDFSGKSVLHKSALGGNIELLKYLLDKRLDSNEKEIQIIFLSEKGLDIKRTSNDRETVLHQCCMNGQIDMCKYLVNTYPFFTRCH